MATLLSALETKVRQNLGAPAATDLFWSSEEIIGWLNDGAKDLWKAIKDLYQKHHYTIDRTNVSLAASGTSLTGVPADVHTVGFIRARTPANYPNLRFIQKDYAHLDFEAALAQTAQDSTTIGVIYYDIIAAGGPVGAPTIMVAPPVNAAIPLELGYVPTIGNQTSGQNNPIPGESDAALIAYATAWAKSKETGRGPDTEWLAIYATEKENLQVALTPRSTQDPEVVEGMFEGWDE